MTASGSRASGVNSSEGRQKVLSDLYEQFFKKALKKEADRLGIAYTPIEACGLRLA